MKIFVQTKNRGHFWTLFWSKIWPSLLENEVFGHFLPNRSSDLSKTLSDTGDNCFESSNDSVVSGEILVLAIFGSKIHCLWWHMVLGRFWPFSSKPLMFFCWFLLFKLSFIVYCIVLYCIVHGFVNSHRKWDGVHPLHSPQFDSTD